jgi:cytoskeletal protein CcmA (bactofilin family)
MTTQSNASDSILAAGVVIEGKIEGTGNIRIAGRFKGNVDVRGELAIEAGASLDGQAKAETVVVAGEVSGQIIATRRVELTTSGALRGDVKAETLTVAAGSKMRGNVEFGWKEHELQSKMPVGSPTVPPAPGTPPVARSR